MKFGEYFKRRRKELKLRQEDFAEFDQSYISRIEKGEYKPIKREAIEQLAQALQLPSQRVDWLWVYSLLDRDPDHYFGTAMSAYPVLAESPAGVSVVSDDIVIQLQDTEQAVVLKLGPPDKKIRVPAKMKWIYEKEGVHVIFADGRVVDVVLK